MRRIAQMIKRRQRFAASIAAVVAMVVVVLFAYGEILGAQQERTVIAFCSHPGASRHLDGSFLDDHHESGDVVAVHYSPPPGVDDHFRESVSETGLHPTLEWLVFTNWSTLIEVPRDQNGDIIVDSDGTIDCTLHATFQIGEHVALGEYTYRIAKAQVGPCVPSTDDITDVSVRVWLNKNKNPEHEAKPCGEEVPGELEIISRPVTPSQPPVTTPTGGGGGGSGGGSDGSGGGTTGGGGTTTGDTNGPDGDSDEQEDDEEDDQSDGQEDTQEDDQSDGQEGGQPEGQEQADGADEQEREQQDSAGSTPSQDSDDAKDPSDTEDESPSVDVPEAEEESDTEAQDLMEQEAQAAEETDTQTAQVDEDNAQIGESGRPGPRVPGTGSGGVVDSKRDLSRQVVLGVSLGSAVTIALLLLGFNRRSSRRTG